MDYLMDTHCHVMDPAFADDYDEVLRVHSPFALS